MSPFPVTAIRCCLLYSLTAKRLAALVEKYLSMPAVYCRLRRDRGRCSNDVVNQSCRSSKTTTSKATCFRSYGRQKERMSKSTYVNSHVRQRLSIHASLTKSCIQSKYGFAETRLSAKSPSGISCLCSVPDEPYARVRLVLLQRPPGGSGF